MRAEQLSTEQRTRNIERRRGWLSLLLITTFAVLMGTTGYFVFHYIDRSTFNDARAFRVLDELVGQFENFQQTMTSLLALVPERAGEEETYAKTLVLPRLQLKRLKSECSTDEVQLAQEQARFVLLRHDESYSFAVSKCVEVSSATQNDAELGKLSPRRLQLSGSMSRLLPTFVTQDFFDTALIGSSKGELLIDIGRAADAPGTVQIQPTRSAAVPITNPAGLLRRGALEIALNHAKEQKINEVVRVDADAVPSQPVVFEDRIAGETYRVYAIAFRPSIAIELAEQPGGAQASQPSTTETLYLVGLKRQSWVAQLSAGLGPSGSLGLSIVVLMIIVLWPLASLRFSGPQDPIPRMQVVALLSAALLLPAILAVTAVWAWNSLHLRIWADSGAEVYAQQIEAVLQEDLSEAAGLLTKYAADFYAPMAAADFASGDENGSPRLLPSSIIRQPRRNADGTEREPAACHRTLAATLAEPVQLATNNSSPRCTLRNWSPLHTVTPLNVDGETFGHRLSAFPKLPYRQHISLPDREYFRALIEHEEWRPGDVWQQAPPPKLGFVAQRLFNRGDAARVLQIAVPIEHAGHRIGVVTSDTRVYAISSALRVPLLRFVVVNASNGAVLFHSNDDRSLAENSLIETDHDPLLQRALLRRASRYTLNGVTRDDHFSSEYMGAAHRFYYRPMAGVPWGIVVFYPVAEVGAVAQQAAIAALAGYISIVIVLVTLSIVTFALLPRRGDLFLLSLIWPRWEARGTYRAVAYCGAAIVVVLISMLSWRLNTQATTLYWIVALAVATACGALCVWLWKVARQQDMTLRSYRACYVICTTLALLLISALPAAWMATSYQDVALRAYFRDQLALAAADLENRESTIAHDLRRWIPDDTERSQRYPSAQVLSRALSSPGYSNAGEGQGCTAWTVTTFDRRPWMSERGPPKLGLFGRTVWAWSTDSNLQRAGRTLLISGSGASALRTTCSRTAQSIRFWRRGSGGTLTQFAVPMAVQTPGTPLIRDPDIDAYYDYWPAATALLLLITLTLSLLLISWTLARRLFGIRIPFASRFVERTSAEAMPVAPLLNVEFKIALLEERFGSSFTTKDGDDVRMAECADTYARIWQKRSRDERLLLHQLAEGKFANPENRAVIERLLHLGFLRLRPWPMIADRGLAAYARCAEADSLFKEWQRAASASTWNSIRTPLLLVVIVIVGVLMWIAGSTMQILSATLAGMATLFGYVTQVTNLFKKSADTPRSG